MLYDSPADTLSDCGLSLYCLLFDSNNENSARKNAVMTLMFWLTPLEAEIRRNHEMVERFFSKAEKFPGQLFIPMPSTVMELTSMAGMLVATTVVVAEGEIIPVVVTAAMVDTVADRFVDVADSVAEGTGPAVKTLFLRTQ